MEEMSGFVDSSQAAISGSAGVAAREAWSARLSWRAARLRGAVVHALASARERARAGVDDLECRAASARARMVARLRREADPTRELARPLLASACVAGVVFLASRSAAAAFGAGAWAFLVLLLLALRSAHRRAAAALQREVQELKELLHVTQALLQVEELDGVEEVLDPQDEPTRAGRARTRGRSDWRRRFGLHWRGPR